MRSTTGGMKKTAAAVALGTLALVAAACSSNSSSSTTTTAPSASTTTTTPPIPTTVIPTQPANSAIAATVPASVHSTGNLVVALDASYPPNEFFAQDGSTIVGMDADLSKAIAQTMGLTPKLVNATFDTIIPAISSGKYNMGASSFTPTIVREKQVDFVNYFNAGEAFYVKAGAPLFTDITQLCGHSVAVESGTTEETHAKAQSVKCATSGKGKVTVLSFTNQTQANVAVSSGRADVGYVDSPVAAYVVANSNGVFQNSGAPFNLSPYGLAVQKNGGMAAPVQATVNLLISNGVYGQILAKWGVQAGAVTSATLNGATS
ncbi:MAG TPA: ABC transporter substrate-binding protein [Acidimicrobiales bacterium]|nr:ABC transporter substrate-binding protein [Acidimicrobiales bacterium]